MTGSWLGLDWAASSRLEFAVPAGTTIPLTADAVLAALRALAVVPSPPGSVERTELELPAGLKTSPVPANGTDAVLARHPVALRQNLHATALWQTELTAASGLLLRPTSDVMVSGGIPWGGGSAPGDVNVYDVTPLNYLQTQEIFALTRPSSEGAEILAHRAVAAVGPRRDADGDR